MASSKPFESVVALKAVLGDMVEFTKASKEAPTFAELEKIIRRDIGKTGLMLFLEFDHGAVLRKKTGLDAPKINAQNAGQSGQLPVCRSLGSYQPEPLSPRRPLRL